MPKTNRLMSVRGHVGFAPMGEKKVPAEPPSRLPATLYVPGPGTRGPGTVGFRPKVQAGESILAAILVTREGEERWLLPPSPCCSSIICSENVMAKIAGGCVAAEQRHCMLANRNSRKCGEIGHGLSEKRLYARETSSRQAWEYILFLIKDSRKTDTSRLADKAHQLTRDAHTATKPWGMSWNST